MAAWMYDEFKHIGVNFADPQQVASYDARQGTNLAREKILVERLKIGVGSTLVEFGCGTGAFALGAALAGADVTAVDVSPAMLAYARTKAAEAGLSNIRFVHAGFLSYQHEGAPVDFAVTKFAFHHLPDFWKAVALRNIYALLKPGGVFYLQDVVFSFTAAEAETSINDWIRGIASETGSGFSKADFEMHVRDEYSTFGWILEGLLRQEGFMIRTAAYESPTYAEYECVKP